MATADTSTPEGVRVDTSCWWSNSYQGTAEALVAAGLVRFDQLPGQPGRGKTIARYLPDGTMLPTRTRPSLASEFHPGFVRIFKVSARQYRVDINVDEAEQKRRSAARDAEREESRKKYEAEQERERQLALAREAGMTPEQWALRGMPMDAEEYRSYVRRSFETHRNMMDRTLANEFCRAGFSLDRATRRRVTILCNAIDESLANARISFDAAAHERGKASRLREAGLLPEQNRPRPQLRLVSR